MFTRRQILSLPLISGLTAMLDKTPKVLLNGEYSSLGLPLTIEELYTLQSGDRIIIQDVDSGKTYNTIISLWNSSLEDRYISLMAFDTDGLAISIHQHRESEVYIDIREDNISRWRPWDPINAKIFRHPRIKSGFGE